MKAALHTLLSVICIAWQAIGFTLFAALVFLAFFYDCAREWWKKWRLGDYYEGPMEE